MDLIENPLTEVITIDGPAASGKSTVGLMLAKKLNYLFLDTGCMYRAVTLAILNRQVDPADEAAAVHIAKTSSIDIASAKGFDDGRLYTVFLEGQDVTWEIRSPEVDAHVSLVSSYKEVRAEMVRQQRLIAHDRAVVMVGRDIGTVVLPNAPLKLFITASAEERARRRLQDRQQQGISASYEEILADIKRRDIFDSEREHSPLKPANDAVIIDTSQENPNEVLDRILSLAAV
ncbi:MAG: (d)CMP kinase [Ardenticatenaceae bacterium]|nr:(d)CMP kinase [Ardenticatenaceae bacterium]